VILRLAVRVTQRMGSEILARCNGSSARKVTLADGLTDHARSLAEEHNLKGVSRLCVVPMCLWESRTRSLFFSVQTKSVIAHGDHHLPVRN
jgi:hypothetical protein